MTFCIITHVEHIKEESLLFGYAPYIKEMNIWNQYATKVLIVAPKSHAALDPIFTAYNHTNIIFKEIPAFSLTSIKELLRTLWVLPKIVFKIYNAMNQADHIHLRCPGNMGLLGALVQILFPKTPKTAKYAGNWDPKSKQPISYKIQKWLLSNTFFTRNMKVLVYGEWEQQTPNIVPFFTATYRQEEATPIAIRTLDQTPIRFLFVGTLSKGKQPLYALELVAALHKKGIAVQLTFLGEGTERGVLEAFIEKNKLQEVVFLAGNQNAATLKKHYQESHFLILASKSEGWPKVVAEAMFWGCVPLASSVSCVPYLLDYGKRGVLLNENLIATIEKIYLLLQDDKRYHAMATEGKNWSRNYTLDLFEMEIKKLMKYE